VFSGGEDREEEMKKHLQYLRYVLLDILPTDKSGGFFLGIKTGWGCKPHPFRKERKEPRFISSPAR
jgi:hypothetical protein